MTTAARTLPLFPLNVVLFPGGPLPLRIFETRYLDMVRRCMREASGFGVVCIVAGAEAGGAADFAEVGTEARIVDFTRLQDGLLGITCIGQGRFRVIEAWRETDGLNVGRVEDLPAEPAVPLPARFSFLADVLQGVLPELGELYAGIGQRFNEAAWVGHRLAELLPLPAGDRQALLEMDDPLARLEAIAPRIRRPAP
jgi:Lon protease-like protein